jgi:hypothetical protein
MIARSVVTSLTLAVIVAGCSHAPTQDQLFTPAELSELVTGQTLYVPGCCDAPTGTLLYLSKDGSGWLDSRLMPGYPATPGGMSIVLQWRVVDGSRVCLWATPRIADMPSFAPPFSQCIQVLRSHEPPGSLTASVTRDGKTRTGELDVYPSNIFPAATIEQYLTQVRVFYGGHIPAWKVPDGAPADMAFN